jgi:hypothetical protein
MGSRLIFRERSNTKPNLSARSVTAVKETSVKILLLEACRRKKRSRKTPFILRKTGIILSRAQGETDGEIAYTSFHLTSDLLNINPFVPCRFGKCLVKLRPTRFFAWYAKELCVHVGAQCNPLSACADCGYKIIRFIAPALPCKQ